MVPPKLIYSYCQHHINANCQPTVSIPGVLDAETSEQMLAPRCSVTDTDEEEEGEEVTEDDATAINNSDRSKKNNNEGEDNSNDKADADRDKPYAEMRTSRSGKSTLLAIR